MAKMAVSNVSGLLTSNRRVGLGEKGFFLNCVNLLGHERGILQPREGRTQMDASPTGNVINRSYYSNVHSRALRFSTTNNVLTGTNAGNTLFNTSLDSTRRYGAATDARKFCYLLASDGLRCIDTGFTTTTIAGIPEALDGQVVIQNTTTGAWMPNNTQVAYRYLFAKKSSNQEFKYGSPSGRLVMVNSVGSLIYPTLRFTLPAEIDTTYFYQVYRTQISTGVTIDAGDEMYLVYENTITAGDITNKYVELNDFVPDGNGGVSLYTNASQSGIGQANTQCEAALDTNARGSLATFDNVLWAGGYLPRAALDVSMLSVNTTNGVNSVTATATTTGGSNVLTAVSTTTNIHVGMIISMANVPVFTTVVSFTPTTVTMSANATAPGTNTAFFRDVITIGGTNYFSSPNESFVFNLFAVSTDPSPARALRETCESLVRVINRVTSNTTVYAVYVSSTNELPGRIHLFARSTRNNTLTMSSTSCGNAFSPNITVAQNLVSQSDPSLLLFSRPDEPYAFPLLNYLRVPENAEIVALSGLRSALLVWTDRGLYIVSGVYGNYSLDLLDSSVRLYPSTIVNPAQTTVINNVAYCYTAKGVVSATENGANIISDPVSNTMVQRTFAVCFGDPARNLIYVPITNTSLVYHADYGIWTSVDTSFRHGSYDPINQRMFFHTNDLSFYSSLPFSSTNYSDGTTAVTILSINTATNVVTLNAPVPAGVKIGDMFTNSGVNSTIRAFVGSTVTLGTTAGMSAGAATISTSIAATLTYCPVGTPDPAMTKQVRYANVMFDGAGIANSGASSTNVLTFSNTVVDKYVSFGMLNDISQSTTSQVDYFSAPNLPHHARFFIPLPGQRGSMFTPSVDVRTVNSFRIIGVEFDYEMVSDKTRR